jgi:gliding motility-associated lipoprotein GldD
MTGSLASYSEDIRTIAYKHIVKADDIIETPVMIPEKKVYGMIYEIKGNTASSLNFYLTDSVDNFLSGALYFNTIPNKDSLAPVISFFKNDIEHLIETVEWK